jgi:hypothetical protein
MVAAALAVWAASGAHATFHLMQIEQVIGGVGGDATAQAIQLRTRAASQCFLNPARLRVRDAAGNNPVLLFDFSTVCAGGPVACVPNCGAGARILLATANFAGATNPSITPNFTLAAPIPESYLAAGSLTFESSTGTVYWRLSWGGDAYTGPNGGASDNDDSLPGDFGPPWPGPLPSEGVSALLFPGPASAESSTNADDYELTAGAAVFTNNAGQSGTVRLPPCPADCGNGDGTVGIVDLLALLGQWGMEGGACDLDLDGVGITDLLILLGAWGGCP